MAEEKNEKLSAETEVNKNGETGSTKEIPVVRENVEQKPGSQPGTTAGITAKPGEETAAEQVEKKTTEPGAVAGKTKTEDIDEQAKPGAATREITDKFQETAFVGDLNFLPEVRTDLPAISPGDLLRVSYRVIEGGKERTQVFEGVVIAIKNTGIAKTITVRKTSFGIAVERIFPLNSKLVQKIEVKKHSKVRRAKLYHLRNLKGKAARLKEVR